VNTEATSNTWRQRFRFALILASAQLAIDLVALPSNQRAETCDFSDVKFESLMLPVLPDDPLKDDSKKEIVFDLLISSKGALMAKNAYYVPRQSYVPPVLPMPPT